MKGSLLSLLCICVLVSCGQPSAQPPSASEADRGIVRSGELLFRSGFGSSTQITSNLKGIVGTDTATGFSWDVDPGWVGHSRFAYAISPDNDVLDFMNTEIIELPGPQGTPTEVLHLQNKGNDPDRKYTSRNEFQLFSKEPPDDFKEGYVRYWTRLQDNLATLVPANKEAGLYYFMEWKEQDSGIRGETGGVSNYRINVGISREANTSDLYWIVTAQQVQPERQTEWQIRSDGVAVPLGEWFLVEAYLKKHATDGRVYFAIDGEVVFDVTARTQHRDHPLPLNYWSIFKLYHNEHWLSQGPTNQWYDDLEIWTGFPPDVAAPSFVYP